MTNEVTADQIVTAREDLRNANAAVAGLLRSDDEAALTAARRRALHCRERVVRLTLRRAGLDALVAEAASLYAEFEGVPDEGFGVDRWTDDLREKLDQEIVESVLYGLDDMREYDEAEERRDAAEEAAERRGEELREARLGL